MAGQFVSSAYVVLLRKSIPQCTTYKLPLCLTLCAVRPLRAASLIKENMKSIVYIELIVISLTVSIFNLKTINDAFSLFALGNVLWGIVPWVYVAVVSFFIKSTTKLVSILSVALTVGCLGIGIVVDTLFFHPDAQGGLAFIFIPLWQLMLFAFITPLLFLIGKKKHITSR